MSHNTTQADCLWYHSVLTHHAKCSAAIKLLLKFNILLTNICVNILTSEFNCLSFVYGLLKLHLRHPIRKDLENCSEYVKLADKIENKKLKI